MWIGAFLTVTSVAIVFMSIDWTPKKRRPTVTLDLTSLPRKKQ